MERFNQQKLSETNFDSNFFGDWQISLPELNQSFHSAEPYPHIVIDNFFSADTVEKIHSGFPSGEWDGWFSYYNPIEIKKACDDLEKIDPFIREIFYQLNTSEFINKIKMITNIPNLECDPYLHGGGLHFIPRNGKLNLHLDYSLHPLTGKERRINIIIYMNKTWQKEWNGDLELWSSELDFCRKTVTPCFNRAAIFQTYDESWHGHPHRLECPLSEARKSLAVYYVSEPRSDASLRKKAHFIQTPNFPEDPRITELLKIRDDRRITEDDIKNIFPDWENVLFSECSKD